MQQAREQALRTIRAEHRSLGAVLHALKATIAAAIKAPDQTDFRLVWRMLYYIEAYPDRLHHPKEDRELFPRVRSRSAAAAQVVDELESQHGQCEGQLNAIRVALGHFEAGVPGSGDALVSGVASFADFYWRHMLLEEQQLLPLAESHLDEADWQAVATSFAADADPMQGARPEDEFWAILHDIVRRTPAPHGLGESRHDRRT